jgi:hypothetical protein
MTTLVSSLARLVERAETSEFAVIGGLAVFVRLEIEYRVTDDLDTVASQHGDEPTAVTAVIEAEGIDGLLGGTKIDCIAVGHVPAAGLDAAQLPGALEDRLWKTASSSWLTGGRWTQPKNSRSSPPKRDQGRSGCEVASPARRAWWP